MKLPTEEDVLAFLVLTAALGEYMADLPDEWAPTKVALIAWRCSSEHDKAVEAVVYARLEAHDGIHAAAIADSERRLEVEQAERRVLAAVANWYGRRSLARLTDVGWAETLRRRCV